MIIRSLEGGDVEPQRKISKFENRKSKCVESQIRRYNYELRVKSYELGWGKSLYPQIAQIS